jgi:hypothetical protein
MRVLPLSILLCGVAWRHHRKAGVNIGRLGRDIPESGEPAIHKGGRARLPPDCDALQSGAASPRSKSDRDLVRDTV